MEIKTLNLQPNARTAVQGMALILLVLLAYFPVLKGGFIWDDVDNVTDNLSLRSLGGLKQIWLTRGSLQQYYPLASTSYWLDYHLWGLKPFGYHAENILLHALGVLLLWRVLKRLNIAGAWLGAALFALHPVCVESVSWVTERRNVLSGVFCLGSILASLKFWLPDLTPSKSSGSAEERVKDQAVVPGLWKYYCLALAFYVCALWSKTAAVGIPAVILLFVWWKRGNIGWRSVCLLAPFLMAGMMMALITIHVEGRIGAPTKDWDLPLLQRCVLSGQTVCFYLSKLLWPHPLLIIYPRWATQLTQPSSYLPLLAGAACLWFLWRKRNDWGRPMLVVVACFAVMLFPVMGFFNVCFFRFSFVSDHFQYLACIAPLALMGAGITAVLDRFGPRVAVLKPTLCGLLLLALGVLTWRQANIYLNDETLWRAAVQNNPDAWAAQNNLGMILLQQGKLDEAMPHLLEAVRVKPDYAEALNNQGIILARKGDVVGAIQKYSSAIQINPRYMPAQFNAGLAYLDKGNSEEAIQHFTKCLETVPNDYRVHYNLARALAGKDRFDEAVEHYRRALAINPQMLEALNNLAWILASNPNPQVRNGAEAVRLAEQACQLTNNREAALLGTLGAAYAEDGRFEEAVDAAKKAEALAEAAGNKELAAKNRRMAEMFSLKRPFREESMPIAQKPGSSNL